MADPKRPVTYSAEPVIWIEVRGYSPPGQDPYWARDDGGLILDLLKWQREQGIHSRRTMSVGAGIYFVLFRPDDAERVVAWLKERAKRVEPKR